MTRLEFIANAFAIVAGAVFIAGAVFWMAVAGSAVGPGCPGDPQWLGHCSAVDGQ